MYDFCTSTAVENKEIEEIMEKLEDGDKESLLMNMLIKTAVDSIIQNEIIHLSNQINPYRKSISLNMLTLPNEKLASLANFINSPKGKGALRLSLCEPPYFTQHQSRLNRNTLVFFFIICRIDPPQSGLFHRAVFACKNM